MQLSNGSQLQCTPTKRTMSACLSLHDTHNNTTQQQGEKVFSNRTKLWIEKAFCALYVNVRVIVPFCAVCPLLYTYFLIKTRLKLISCNMKHIFSISFVSDFGCGAACARIRFIFHFCVNHHFSHFTQRHDRDANAEWGIMSNDSDSGASSNSSDGKFETISCSKCLQLRFLYSIWM